MIFSRGFEGTRAAMPQFWKGEGGNGFRVRYSVRSDRSTEPRESDLVFVDERPFAVLEWSEAGAAMAEEAEEAPVEPDAD